MICETKSEEHDLGLLFFLVFPLDRALKFSDILAEAGVRLGHYSVFGGVLSQRQAGADAV